MEPGALRNPSGLPNRFVLRALGAATLTTAAIVIVLIMRIGPVLVTLSPGRGIHSGDSLGVMSLVAALALIEPLLRRWLTSGTTRTIRT